MVIQLNVSYLTTQFFRSDGYRKRYVDISQVLGQYVSLIFSDTFCTKLLSPMWSHQFGEPSRDTDMRPENSVKIWNLLAI